MRRNLAACLLLFAATAALAAPRPDLWDRWRTSDETSGARVDHGPWARFLARYLVTDHPSGIHRLRYADVTAADRADLDGYLDALAATAVSGLSRAEQKAYWINLYNAATVREVLEHDPVDSIREIRSGWFTAGPWDKPVVAVEGTAVTLNDIEHRILRPLFRDNRVHYALNCASLGCPNLLPVPFTAGNTDRLLDRAARAYVNHPRGARIENGTLRLSGLYDWYRADFGGSDRGVIAHLLRYAGGDLARGLATFSGPFRYAYDWSLNRP